MSQMCPNCSFDNPDDAKKCGQCPTPLRGLLGENILLSERYKVTSVLGCGSMGAVYLAEDTRLSERRCAIKENRIDPQSPVDVQEQTREQFLAEANILARLDHPNLPKVSDYFIEKGHEVRIVDNWHHLLRSTRIEREIEAFQPDVIGISSVMNFFR